MKDREPAGITNKDLNQIEMALAIRALELKDDPFVPEDLLFVPSVQVSEHGEVTSRIYSRDGFNIARHVDLSKKEWVVLSPKGVANTVLLSSMYNAIIVLQACGMPITFYDYYRGGEEDFFTAPELLDDVVEN